MKKSTRRISAGLVVVLIGFLSGCANVSVHKVPTPTQYQTWTDERQAQADVLEGFRFYLPRPFVNVFESFPLHADVYIIDGIVSPDGNYVFIKVPAESRLSGLLGEVGMDKVISARDIIAPDPGILRAVSDMAKEIAAQAGTAPDKKEPKKDESEKDEQPPPKVDIKTGQELREVTNDNSTFAYQPMRGNMDIVYLPDFEEQYVVSNKANLGNAQFQLNLGQGWSLQGFNSLADNSALNQRIFRLIDTSLDIAEQAVPTLLGLPPLPAGVTDAIRPQAGEALADDVKGAIPGTPVSLKIMVVHYATKGLYPVIKPRELIKANAGTGLDRAPAGGQGGFLLDIVSGQQGTSGPAVMASPAQPRSSIPVYPYQYISFNTFQYLAIQIVRADNQPFGTLYDKTGTAGDPGDRQAADLRPYIIPHGKDEKDEKTSSPGPGAAAAHKLAAALNGIKIGIDGTDLNVTETKVVDNTSVRVTLDKPIPSGTDASAVQKKLFKAASEKDPEIENVGAHPEMIKFADVDVAGGITPQAGVAPAVRRRTAVAPVNPVVKGLSPAEIRSIQASLCMTGRDLDGQWGPAVQRALARYQKTTGKDPADGVITDDLRKELLELTGEQIAARCWLRLGEKVERPPDPVAAGLGVTEIVAIQVALCLKESQVDGKWGPVTQGALRRWQAANNQTPVDGVLTDAQSQQLLDMKGQQVATHCR